VFLRIFEQVRRKYKFEVVGHVVMREHFHILIGEPEKGNHPASSRFSSRPSPDVYSNRPEGDEAINPCCGRKVFPFRTVISGKRVFYDFNVYSNEKRFEKLRYMHRNPVKRGLVSSPELWAWSSFRAYMYAEPSIVKIDELEPRNTKKKPEPK